MKKYYQQIIHALSSFSSIERVLFSALVLVFLASTIGMVATISRHYTTLIPARGGELSEGIVGTVRFINPVLAIEPIDKDLAELVYSGLVRTTPEGLVFDLAESQAMSEDELTYTFTLRDNATFHDGAPVTGDDVVFTIDRIQDSDIGSPLRASFQDISVSAPDEKTVIFTLPRPSSAFLDTLTVGILPAHLWRALDSDDFRISDMNLSPIGSGPYMIKKMSANREGIPTQYLFIPFKDFSLGRPKIKNLTIHLYQTERDAIDAFNRGTLDTLGGIHPSNLELVSGQRYTTNQAPLPRTFGLFINENALPAFADHRLVEALSTLIDRERLVENIFSGYATPTFNALPPSMTTSETLSEKPLPEELFAAAGWSQNDTSGGYLTKGTTPLALTIATGDNPELQDTATFIRDTLERAGIQVSLKFFDTEDLRSSIIPNRNFDVLLFGQSFMHDTDLYAFWHSSQTSNPGLNITGFENDRVDVLLASARQTNDRGERAFILDQANTLIRDESKAVFLYAPSYIYLTRSPLKGFTLEGIVETKDRFALVHEWYVRTDRVWNIFTR